MGCREMGGREKGRRTASIDTDMDMDIDIDIDGKAHDRLACAAWRVHSLAAALTANMRTRVRDVWTRGVHTTRRVLARA